MSSHGGIHGAGERGPAPGAEPWVLVVLPCAGRCGGAAALGVSALCFTTQITGGKLRILQTNGQTLLEIQAKLMDIFCFPL